MKALQQITFSLCFSSKRQNLTNHLRFTEYHSQGLKIVQNANETEYFDLLQVINAALALAAKPQSKLAQENMEMFKEQWEKQVRVLTDAVDDITSIDDFLAVSGNELHITPSLVTSTLKCNSCKMEVMRDLLCWAQSTYMRWYSAALEMPVAFSRADSHRFDNCSRLYMWPDHEQLGQYALLCFFPIYQVMLVTGTPGYCCHLVIP